MTMVCPQCDGKGCYFVRSDIFKNEVDGSNLVYPIDCDICGGRGTIEDFRSKDLKVKHKKHKEAEYGD